MDSNFFSIIPSKTYSLPINKEVKGQDYISFGLDNQYPKYLLDLFYGSSLHNRIISRKQAEIVGHGLYSKLDKRGINAFIKKCNNKGDSLSDVMKKCTLDYLLFGGFSFQIIFNKGGDKIVEIYYLDVSRLRFNPDQDKVKYSREWFTGRRKSKVIEYELFNGETKGSKIYYFKGNFSRDTYPIPEYIGSLMGIESSIEIASFELNRIKNGMFPALHFSFKNGDPGPEGRREFEQGMKNKYQGSQNAGDSIITYCKNGEQPLTIEPIILPDLDSQFNTLQGTVRDDLFYGHGFPPILLGVMVPGKIGSQADYTQAQENFTSTYVEPNRKTILDIFDRILSINFDQPDLAVIPLKPIGNVVDSSTILASVMTPNELRKLAQSYGLIEDWHIPEGESLIGISDLAPAKNKVRSDDLPSNTVAPTGEQNIGDPTTAELN